MIWAILPVKNPRNAKQRLVSFLDAAQREALARLLYRRTLAALSRCTAFDQVVVVSNDGEVMEHAKKSGAMVFEEREQVSHSASADAACARAREMGASTAVLTPIDVPLVSTEDFHHLCRAAKPGVIIVPSADGTGTNAMVRTPADVIESRFGPGSFLAHLEQARGKGIHAEELRVQGLMFDIDTPEDVAEFLSQEHEGPIAQFLRSTCVSR